jgi:hypothetical protein
LTASSSFVSFDCRVNCISVSSVGDICTSR